MRKKEKSIILKTKRLEIRPLSEPELEQRVAAESDSHLRAALGEMLAGCREHPESALFYTEWEIARRGGGAVGSIGFKGPSVQNECEVGYGIDEPFRGNGYAAEALTTLANWAFDSDDQLYFLTAQTEPGNTASARVLEKCGFEPDGEGEEGPRYMLERPASSWMSVGISLGMCLGVAIGVSFDGIAVGIGIGVMLGLCIGLRADSADKKKRAELKAKRG